MDARPAQTVWYRTSFCMTKQRALRPYRPSGVGGIQRSTLRTTASCWAAVPAWHGGDIPGDRRTAARCKRRWTSGWALLWERLHLDGRPASNKFSVYDGGYNIYGTARVDARRHPQSRSTRAAQNSADLRRRGHDSLLRDARRSARGPLRPPASRRLSTHYLKHWQPAAASTRCNVMCIMD